MKGKLKKNIGFSLMPFAFLFLFEPGYTIFDPLPDFIGYVLLCMAVINLSDISPRIEEAYNGFRKGVLIGFFRYVAIYLLTTFFLNNEKSVGLLLFTFVFSFFEVIVLLPAYKSFFEGILSLGMMHDGESPYRKRRREIVKRNRKTGETYTVVREGSRNASEKCYSLTCAFLLVRNLATALPEFTTLATNSAYEFIMLLRWFGILITLPIGISWLISMLNYCKRIRREREFIDRLSDLYIEKVEQNPQFYTVRIIATGLGLMLVAFVLSIDFYADYINMLPDFFSFAVLAAAAIFLREYSNRWKYVLASSLVSILTSVVTHLTATAFHSEYYPNAIRKNAEAYDAFYRMVGLHVIDAVMLTITVALALLLLKDVYCKCLDFSKNSLIDPEELVKRRFSTKAILVFVTVILTAVGSVYFVMSQPFYYTGRWYFYYSTMISVFLSLIMGISAATLVSHAINFVKYCYRRYI